MAKKWIPIIAVIVAVIAIIVIAVIGSNPNNRNRTVYVTGINVTTPHTSIYYNEELGGEIKCYVLDDENTTLADGHSTFDLDYTVTPTNATYQTVNFSSSDESIATVDEEGVVSFLQNDSVFVTLTSQDERAISTTVQLVWLGDAISEFSIAQNTSGGGNLTYENLSDTQMFAVEDDVLYLYKDMEYVISTDAIIEFSDTTVATFIDGTLSTEALGSFTFDLTFEGVEPITQQVEVVEYINTFSMGTSYSSYQSTTSSIDSTNYLDKDVEKYQVGVDNPYHFDIIIQNNDLQTVSLQDANLDYTVYNTTTGEEVLVENNSQIFTVNQDGTLSFNESNVGNSYKVVVEPKYNFLNRQALTFEIELTDGVNVYTHSDLKTNFADLSINNIVFHSNISVVVEDNQLDPSGRLMNYDSLTANGGVTGDIYTRLYTASDLETYSDNLNVNLIGNYFSIDATNMPYLTIDRNYSSHNVMSWTEDSGYPCASVQTAIFKVQENTADAYSNGVEKENIVNFNISNLRLTGNTSTGIIYETDPETGEPIIVNDEAQVIADQGSTSAGFMGRGAVVVSTDNVIITNTNIGIYVTGSFGGIDADYTYIFDSWANGTFGWRTSKVELANTTIRQAGGAAINVTDATVSDAYSPEWMDVTFTFGPNLVVDNYVTGAEGYFIVNNLSTVVPALKGELDGTLRTALSKTVLKDSEDGSIFNFVIQFSREDSNYSIRDYEISNIGSEDGWRVYVPGRWLVRQGEYLVNENNPNERFLVGDNQSTTITNITVDSQFVMNMFKDYNDSEPEYVTIERKSGYFTNNPVVTAFNGVGLAGISEITSTDDALLIAGVAGGYMTDENFVQDITGQGTATGSVATLLNGEETLIQTIEGILDGYGMSGMFDMTSTKQVIKDKISALGSDISSGLVQFGTLNDMQKIVYLCDVELLNNINNNIETFNTILPLIDNFIQDPEQNAYAKANIQAIIDGYAQVAAGARANSTLVQATVAITCNNNQLSFKDSNGTDDLNLIEAKINRDALGQFSGILIYAGLFDYVAA